MAPKSTYSTPWYDDMSPRPIVLWHRTRIIIPRKCDFTKEWIPSFSVAYYTIVRLNEHGAYRKWTSATQYTFRKLKGDI